MSHHVLDRVGWATDLLLVAGLASLTAFVLVFVPWIDGPVRSALGIPFLLLYPGYAIVSATFPERPIERSEEGSVDARETAPGWSVRIGLSLLVSAVIVGSSGVLVDWLFTIRLGPAVGVITAVTLVGSALATARRSRRPRAIRANPLTNVLRSGVNDHLRPQTVTLAVAVVFLLGAVAFVGVAPSQGEAFTEAYLLAGPDGELAAEEYPESFVAGDGQSISVAIENHEHRTVSYEVVAVLERVDAEGTVADRTELDRFEVELDHDERAVVDRTIAPETTGEGLRLRFLVYKDGAGAEANSPDLSLQVWIDVVEA